MFRSRNFLALLLFFVFVRMGIAKTGDLIAIVNLISGKADSVLISDMFYSEKYDIHPLSCGVVNVKFNTSSRMLVFKAPRSFEGWEMCSILNGNDTLAFPVFVRKKIPVKFRFKPKRKFKEITLFGEFNQWNRHSIPMHDSDGDGVYEVDIELDPGVYQYKFYADTLELCDPSNPDSVANGLGGFNSVIKVKPEGKHERFLHVGSFDIANGTAEFSFYFGNDSFGEKISRRNILALLNNERIEDDFVGVQKNEITISLPTEMLRGKNILRVAVSSDGIHSNLQEVFIYDGKPYDNDAPFDWHDGIIYSLLTDRFFNGDKGNDRPVVHDSLSWKANYEGGDFQGIIDKIESGYFDSLGINVLWISPVNDNPNEAFRGWPKPHRWFTGYHGYWPISAYRVEEHFGNMELLKSLVQKAHERGIKVLLDFVSHHVHKYHPYFKEHRDWFGSMYLPDGKPNIRLWDEHRLTTWFEPYLPSFNYLNSAEAVDTMTANALWWLKKTGADGFRHDAVKHVPNIFWRTLTRKLKSLGKKHYYQIGETFGNYALVSSYVNNGQLDAQFNFNLYNVAQAVFIDSSKTFADLRDELRKTRQIYGPLPLMGNIMDSHDKNRYIAYADGDIPLWMWDATEMGWKNPPKVDHPSSYLKTELYLAYEFSIPGVPVVYYGSEFGMTGASDPDNRRMMRFGNQLNFYEKKMLDKVRHIIHLRRKHTALRYGDIYFLKADTSVFAFVRSDFNERILIVFNKTAIPRRVSVDFPACYDVNLARDLMDGEVFRPERDEMTIVLPAYGFKFLKLER